MSGTSICASALLSIFHIHKFTRAAVELSLAIDSLSTTASSDGPCRSYKRKPADMCAVVFAMLERLLPFDPRNMAALLAA